VIRESRFLCDHIINREEFDREKLRTLDADRRAPIAPASGIDAVRSDQIDPEGFVETTMLTSVLRRIRLPMLVLALTASAWSSCRAVGSFQTKPLFPSTVRADDPPLPPTITWPNASVSAFIGGCGKGRVRDLQTRGCRGPADIPSIAR
jgi:hypothetical protein